MSDNERGTHAWLRREEFVWWFMPILLSGLLIWYAPGSVVQWARYQLSEERAARLIDIKPLYISSGLNRYQSAYWQVHARYEIMEGNEPRLLHELLPIYSNLPQMPHEVATLLARYLPGSTVAVRVHDSRHWLLAKPAFSRSVWHTAVFLLPLLFTVYRWKRHWQFNAGNKKRRPKPPFISLTSALCASLHPLCRRASCFSLIRYS